MSKKRGHLYMQKKNEDVQAILLENIRLKAMLENAAGYGINRQLWEENARLREENRQLRETLDENNREYNQGLKKSVDWLKEFQIKATDLSIQLEALCYLSEWLMAVGKTNVTRQILETVAEDIKNCNLPIVSLNCLDG